MMKLRKICLACQGRNDCVESDEGNWRDCRGKSFLQDKKAVINNKKLIKKLMKNTVEV